MKIPGNRFVLQSRQPQPGNNGTSLRKHRADAPIFRMRPVQKLIGCFILLYCFQANNSYGCMPQFTTNNLNEIIWNDDQFICVGDSGMVFKSIDGRTWERVPFPAADNLKSIEKIDTMLMFRSSHEGTFFLTDHSLQNFKTVTTPVFPANCYTYFKGSIFFIDTISFAPKGRLPAISGFPLLSGSSQLQRYWVPNYGEPFYYINSLASSPDRIIVSGNHTSMVDSTLVNNPFLLSSADGITWDTTRERLLGRMEQILWIGDKFIACGSNGLLYSQDGIGWESSFFRTRFADNRCLWGYGLILIASSGKDYTYFAVTQTVPPDTLIRWQELSGRDVFTVNGTAISPTAAVVVGSGGNIYRYLPAATRWAKCVTPFVATMNSVCWNGSMFVTVGNEGFIAVSQDGAAWDYNARIVKDTVLTRLPETYICLQGVISIAASCTSKTTVTIEPGTILKIAPGAHMVLSNLTAKGIKGNPIQFTAQDAAQPWGGLSIVDGQLDHCVISGGAGGRFYDNAVGLLHVKNKVTLAHSLISTEAGQQAILFVDDGQLEVQSLRIKGPARISASSGASYVFHNSLFEDQTSCSVSSIQNDFASRGMFVNCTFGSGSTMSAAWDSKATQSQSLHSANCAFVDNPMNAQKFIGYSQCASGDSLFVDAAAKNFHLIAGAVAIDSGLDESVQYSEDLDGNPRIYGKRVDVGAFEFNPEVTPVATGCLTGPRHSIEIHRRMLKLQFPATGAHAFDISIVNCAGRLLWNRHLSPSEFRSGCAAVALPRMNPGIVVIRIRGNGPVAYVKTVLSD